MKNITDRKDLPLYYKPGLFKHKKQTHVNYINGFVYEDFNSSKGDFLRNEEKYFIGKLNTYEFFHMRIKSANTLLENFGHAHFILRSPEKHYDYSTIYLFLEDGDTVTKVRYQINRSRESDNKMLFLSNAEMDEEFAEMGILHFLQHVMPEHFKLNLTI